MPLVAVAPPKPNTPNDGVAAAVVVAAVVVDSGATAVVDGLVVPPNVKALAVVVAAGAAAEGTVVDDPKLKPAPELATTAGLTEVPNDGIAVGAGMVVVDGAAVEDGADGLKTLIPVDPPKLIGAAVNDGVEVAFGADGLIFSGSDFATGAGEKLIKFGPEGAA